MTPLTLTTSGIQRIADAIFFGVPITGTMLAVGQAAPELLTSASQQLGEEVARFPVVAIISTPSQADFKLTLDGAGGPWLLREIGLFDSTGVLIAYGALPDIYKPTGSDFLNFRARISLSLAISQTSPVPIFPPSIPEEPGGGGGSGAGGEPLWTTPDGRKVQLQVNDNLSLSALVVTELPPGVSAGEDLVFTTPNGTQVRLTVTNRLSIKPISI